MRPPHEWIKMFLSLLLICLVSILLVQPQEHQRGGGGNVPLPNTIVIFPWADLLKRPQCSPAPLPHYHGLSPEPKSSHLKDHQPPTGFHNHSVGDIGTGMASGGSPWHILHDFLFLYLWWCLEWRQHGRNHNSLQTQCALLSPTTKETKWGASGISRSLGCPPPVGGGIPTIG